VDQAVMSVPSELVTCCEVNGEEVRAIEFTPPAIGDQSRCAGLVQRRTATLWQSTWSSPHARTDVTQSTAKARGHRPTRIAGHPG
jgi:hypothetical protein